LVLATRLGSFQTATVPSSPIKWNTDAVEWDVGHLSQYVKLRFAGKKFKNDDDSSWLVKGTTPIDADNMARSHLETDKDKTWTTGVQESLHEGEPYE